MQSFTSATASPALSVEAMCQLLSAHQASTMPIPASPPTHLSSSYHSRMSLESALSTASLLAGSGALTADTGGPLSSSAAGAQTMQGLQSQLRASSQRVQELEYALSKKQAEFCQLDVFRQRAQEVEARYALKLQELQDQLAAQQTQIQNQQVKIVVLEEQLKMAGSSKLAGALTAELSNSSDQLQLHAAMLLASGRCNSVNPSSGPGSSSAIDSTSSASSSALLQLPLAMTPDRSSHASGDFTRDQEVFPVNPRGAGAHRSNSLLSNSLAEAWSSLSHAPSAPQPVLQAAAEAWQLASSQPPTAFGSLASSSWEHNTLLSQSMMTRAQSMVDPLPSLENDIFGGLDRPGRAAQSLHVHHLAGLLPPDFERYLESGALDGLHSSNSVGGCHSSAAGELRHNLGGGGVHGSSGRNSRSSQGLKQHQGAMLRANSMPHQGLDLSRGARDDQERSISSVARPMRKWADTWGPEGEAEDACDATADTEDQDQNDHCLSHVSPGGDDKGEDPGAPQELDAAAQNARLRSKQDAQPNTCVYVGFLGWWVTEKDLHDYFSPYGQLASVRLLISKKSRRSREQAFVEYSTVDQAQRAITWLDSIDYPALVKQLGCGGLVVRFADRKKPLADM